MGMYWLECIPIEDFNCILKTLNTMNAASYSRPLTTPLLIQNFLGALGYNNSNIEELDEIVTGITKGEIELAKMQIDENTLNKKTFRHLKYTDDYIRWNLRKQIVNELYTYQRIEDDKICLGEGGGAPLSKLLLNSEAHIVIGLPASGKSGVSNKIADHTGAIILDSDYAKRKLPEFKRYNSGASLLHRESDALIFPQTIENKPSDFYSLFELCIKHKNNICIPKIGHDHVSIKNFCSILKNKYGYKLHLTLITLDRRKATIRAIKRFKDTGRYVPLGLIFDGYANDPILTYYRLKNTNSKDGNLFESFCAISTDVEINTPPIIVDTMGDTPLIRIYNN